MTWMVTNGNAGKIA